MRARTGAGRGRRQEEGWGLGVHGLFCVFVTLPMSQLLMSWLKEVALLNTAAAQQ